MHDVTELFDDLVAIRRAQAVLRETASEETRSDLWVVIKRIESKLTFALSILTEDEREEAIESLDRLYDVEARRELETFL